MKSPTMLVATLGASALILVVATPASHALNLAQIRCQEGIAKRATKFVSGLLLLEQQCREADLADPGSCPAPDPGKVATLAANLRAGIDYYCPASAGNLAALGFPGPCADVNPADGFTPNDLKDCIESSHRAGVEAIRAFLFDPAVVGPLTYTDVACQHAFAKSGVRFARYLLPTVQKCRNGILRGNIVGVQPSRCATDYPPTALAIAKLEQTAWSTIVAKCRPEEVLSLKLCSPDQVTADAAADCLIAAIRRLIDDPVVADPPDLIDYEYAEPGVCGDNRVNRVGEECDGTDDAACPGQCGAADGFFACLCQDRPRTRVVEHANADLDLGWTGRNHDQHVAEGGGYVADLWDCDGPGGPDTLCAVGPSCNLPPHQSCSPAKGVVADADSMCPGAGNLCRKTAGGGTGPHCEIAFKRSCNSDADCHEVAGDRCVKVPHGPPLPLAAAGISVCVASIFTEDVAGTTDLETGASAVRMRQQLITHLGGALDQPCPVCGGFCAGPTYGGASPNVRTRCDDDTDCPSSFCVADAVCSYGPNADRPCRPNPPFGGPTAFFGNPSVDCPPSVNEIGRLDVLVNPSTTATTTLTANYACNAPAFTEKACVLGANDGRQCTLDVDCPGGACHEQCFCPNTMGSQQKPNGCNAACVMPGGAGPDGEPCVDDADCPGGFCHAADCRLNPADTDSAQEGICTTGPTTQHCSIATFQPCANDAHCSPPACPFCEPGETCVIENQQCFVNGQIVRAGSLGVPDRVSAGVFCIPPTTSAAVNGLAGWPGPGAITQPETTVVVGF